MSNRIKIVWQKGNTISNYSLSKAKKHCRSCLICGHRTWAIGQFVPWNPDRLARKMGEIGTMFYGICRKCLTDHSAQDKAQVIIYGMSEEHIVRAERKKQSDQ